MTTFENLFIFGNLIRTSAIKRLKEGNCFSTGLPRMLMSVQLGKIVYRRSMQAKSGILFPLKLKYWRDSCGGSSSSNFSSLFLRKCKRFNLGRVSYPIKLWIIFASRYSSSNFGMSFRNWRVLNLLSTDLNTLRLGWPVQLSFTFSSLLKPMSRTSSFGDLKPTSSVNLFVETSSQRN